jgi:hypothetical protein
VTLLIVEAVVRFLFAICMNNFAFIKNISGSKHSDSHMRCKTCGSSFSISHCGHGDIKTDLNRDKHKRAISAAAFSSLLTTFIGPEKVGYMEEQLTASEGPFAYRTFSPYHSFRSMD